MPEENPRRKSSYPSVIIGIIVLALVAVGAYFAWKQFSIPIEPLPPQPVEEAPVVEETAVYASTTLGSVTYPRAFSVNDAFQNTSVNPQKPIAGVKFTIPAEMATGTNLSADSGISIEQLPRARSCTADIYLAANVKARSFTENNVQYSLATSSEAATGNLYEEIVYALSGSSPCTAVRYSIHSTNIGNYPAGTVHEFDRAALIATFDKIRQSLVK